MQIENKKLKFFVQKEGEQVTNIPKILKVLKESDQQVTNELKEKVKMLTEEKYAVQTSLSKMIKQMVLIDKTAS